MALSKIENINTTAPQPQRNVLKFFAIVKKVDTRCLTRLQTMYNVLNLAQNDEIMSKINLQEPQSNRNAIANFASLIRTSTVTENSLGVTYLDVPYVLSSECRIKLE